MHLIGCFRNYIMMHGFMNVKSFRRFSLVCHRF